MSLPLSLSSLLWGICCLLPSVSRPAWVSHPCLALGTASGARVPDRINGGPCAVFEYPHSPLSSFLSFSFIHPFHFYKTATVTFLSPLIVSGTSILSQKGSLDEEARPGQAARRHSSHRQGRGTADVWGGTAAGPGLLTCQIHLAKQEHS